VIWALVSDFAYSDVTSMTSQSHGILSYRKSYWTRTP